MSERKPYDIRPLRDIRAEEEALWHARRAAAEPATPAIWTTTEPPSLAAVARAVEAHGLPLAWICSPRFVALLHDKLLLPLLSPWDGWGGEDAKRKAAPLACLPLEVDPALDGWGFRHDPAAGFVLSVESTVGFVEP